MLLALERVVVSVDVLELEVADSEVVGKEVVVCEVSDEEEEAVVRKVVDEVVVEGANDSFRARVVDSDKFGGMSVWAELARNSSMAK